MKQTTSTTTYEYDDHGRLLKTETVAIEEEVPPKPRVGDHWISAPSYFSGQLRKHKTDGSSFATNEDHAGRRYNDPGAVGW